MCPQIEYEGKILYEIGCRKCQQSEWKIYSDKTEFVAKCGCGHIIPLKPTQLKLEPDTTAIPLRLIT